MKAPSEEIYDARFWPPWPCDKSLLTAEKLRKKGQGSRSRSSVQGHWWWSLHCLSVCVCVSSVNTTLRRHKQLSVVDSMTGSKVTWLCLGWINSICEQRVYSFIFYVFWTHARVAPYTGPAASYAAHNVMHANILQSNCKTVSYFSPQNNKMRATKRKTRSYTGSMMLTRDPTRPDLVKMVESVTRRPFPSLLRTCL